MAVLEGKARDVAAGIRRHGTNAGLCKQKPKKADHCARYLTNKAHYLDYPGPGRRLARRHGRDRSSRRHLVKDRMVVSSPTAGAEADLKLRAVRSNGGFDAYWQFHLRQERRRVHQSRYADGVIPAAVSTLVRSRTRSETISTPTTRPGGGRSSGCGTG